jgi:hypothetical protein
VSAEYSEKVVSGTSVEFDGSLTVFVEVEVDVVVTDSVVFRSHEYSNESLRPPAEQVNDGLVVDGPVVVTLKRQVHVRVLPEPDDVHAPLAVG